MELQKKKKATKRLRNRNVTFQLDGDKLMKKKKVIQGKPIRNAVRLTIAKKNLKAKKKKTQKKQKKKDKKGKNKK